MTDLTAIDVAICTFRRPQLLETLSSLSDINVPDGYAVRIVIADNDDTPSAQNLVDSFDCPFPITYQHAPARNISIARNACLEMATAPILVFIDDDETVSKDWLSHLIAEQERSGAEVVLGPSIAVYDDAAPAWMREGDYHSSRPVYVDGKIITGYCCNTLVMRTSPPARNVRFQLGLGKTGGEDTIYLATIHRQGGTISYAEDALVYEDVPPKRAQLMWMLKRRFRFGHTHGLMLDALHDLGTSGRIREFVKAAVKCLSCGAMAVVNLPSRANRNRWLLRGALHAGVCLRFLGAGSIESYGLDQPA